MDKLSKQYVKTVKSFFPMYGKGERKYLKSLELNIVDFCEEASISDLDELYEKFGNPSEVVNTYYTSMDTNYILKQISRTKLLRVLGVALISSILIALSAYCTLLYAQFQIFENEQVHFVETIIK